MHSTIAAREVSASIQRYEPPVRNQVVTLSPRRSFETRFRVGHVGDQVKQPQNIWFEGAVEVRSGEVGTLVGFTLNDWPVIKFSSGHYVGTTRVRVKEEGFHHV